MLEQRVIPFPKHLVGVCPGLTGGRIAALDGRAV